MVEHYIVTVDEQHLRIFTETRVADRFRPRLEIVESLDLPKGEGPAQRERGFVDSEVPFLPAEPEPSDGDRPPTSHARTSRAKNVRLLATELDTFLQQRPAASWDFAAPAELYDAVVEGLSPDTRRRLKRVLSEDLIHQSAEDVHAHFALTVQ